MLVEQCKKLVCIYQIEVARHGQVAGRIDVWLYEWVAEFHIVFSLCAITQVTQHHLSYKAHIALHQSRHLQYFRVHFFQLRYFRIYILEYLGYSL